MAASVMNYHGSGLRLTGGITKSRVRSVPRRELSNPSKLKCVRKMLFGPVDREETRRVCETELKKHVTEASLRWNFDFASEQPIRSPDSKYIWERVPPLSGDAVTPSEGPGPMMTLSSAAHIRTIQVIAAGIVSPPGSSSPSSSASSSVTSSPSTSICSGSDMESDLSVVVGGNGSVIGDLSGSGVAGEASNDGVAKRMVQKKMTDFLKEKKRTNAVLATVAKKRDYAGISAAAGPMAATATAASSSSQAESAPSSSSLLWGLELPPAKRMRTASGASHSSAGSHSS